MIPEGLIYFGELLGVIGGSAGVSKLLFYSKSEIDKQIKELTDGFNNELKQLEIRLEQKSEEADKNLEDKWIKSEDELYKAMDTIQLKMDKNHAEVKEELSQTKEIIFEKLLEAERASNKSRQELYDRLTQNKQIFDDYNKNIMETISQIKQDQKEMIVTLTQFVNDIKDELKTDSNRRYHELTEVMSKKVPQDDFDRLENKFDKLIENVAELKAIVNTRFDNFKK